MSHLFAADFFLPVGGAGYCICLCRFETAGSATLQLHAIVKHSFRYTSPVILGELVNLTADLELNS